MRLGVWALGFGSVPNQLRKLSYVYKIRQSEKLASNVSHCFKLFSFVWHKLKFGVSKGRVSGGPLKCVVPGVVA